MSKYSEDESYLEYLEQQSNNKKTMSKTQFKNQNQVIVIKTIEIKMIKHQN